MVLGKASIDVSEIEKYRQTWKNRTKRIKKNTKTKLGTVLRAGKNYAKAIAPVDTGAMVQAISYRTKKGRSAELISKMPQNAKNRRNFPYHIYMHMNPKARKWKGDPQFMLTTATWLKKEFPKQMREAIKNGLRVGTVR